MVRGRDIDRWEPRGAMSVDEQLDASLARAEEALQSRSVDDLRMAQASLTGMLDLHARKDPHTEKLFRDVLRTVTEELNVQNYSPNGEDNWSEYRGMRIEAIDNATQLGYYTGEGAGRRRGKGRNIGRQYLIHLGESGSGGTKVVSTMRAAREYIDEYLGPEHTANGRATVADPTAAHELDLYIANTYELVGAPNSIGKSIDANLKRKLDKGTYDSARAPQAWQHLVDEGAKRYEREFGSGSPIFNAATRRQVAEDFARAWEQDSAEFQEQVRLSDEVISEVIDEERLGQNPRRIPEHLQGYEDFTQKDFEDDLRGKGYGVRDARYQAARSAQQTGRTNYLPPRLPEGWKLTQAPIFNRRTAKPAFVAFKGGKYQVFDHTGRSLSGVLRNMRYFFEWVNANNYGEESLW